MQKLSAKLGIIEIVTRNKVAQILGINDTNFISRQTFGFWIKLINDNKIQNEVVNLREMDFRKYSKFNKHGKNKMPNFIKVTMVYSLLLTIRNRAFHFENLLKLNDKQAPRISTNLNGRVVGIMPFMLENFLDDFLDCFDSDLRFYLKR